MMIRPMTMLQLLKFMLATVILYLHRAEHREVEGWRDRLKNANTRNQVIIDPLVEGGMHCLFHRPNREGNIPVCHIAGVLLFSSFVGVKYKPERGSLGALCEYRCGRKAGELGWRAREANLLLTV